MENKKSLEKLLAKVFSVSPEEINDQTSPDNLSSWDSFNGLRLVQELEKNFNVNFDLEEMAAVKNVGDLKNLLKKKGI